MSRARLPLTLAAAGAALVLLAGCSSASAIEPFTSDDGYDITVEQVGDIVSTDDGESEACMFGVTATNKSGERVYAGDITGNRGGGGDFSRDDLASSYKSSADGEGYEGWTVPDDGWTATPVNDGESIKWLLNADCTGVQDGGTVEVNLDDTSRELTIKR